MIFAVGLTISLKVQDVSGFDAFSAPATPAAWRCWRRCAGLRLASSVSSPLAGRAHPRNRHTPASARYDPSRVRFLDGPWRREAARLHCEVHHIAEIAASRHAVHVRTIGSVWRPFCSAMYESQIAPKAAITAAAISNSGRAAMLQRHARGSRNHPDGDMCSPAAET
jgi:hypothetical protein